MMTTTALALFAPCAAGTMIVAARNKWWRSTADARGIALQTVIVMVVLLAVAGGVAAVLLTRGGEAIDDIENQQISRQAGNYNNERLCDAAGFVWSDAGANRGCNAAAGLSVAQQKAAATTQPACGAIPGTWQLNAGTTDPNDHHCV